MKYCTFHFLIAIAFTVSCSKQNEKDHSVNELDKIQQIRTKIDSGNERINELNNKLKQQLDSLEINLDVSSVDTIRKSGKVVIYSYDTIVIKNQ
jgi:hypothetical protein